MNHLENNPVFKFLIDNNLVNVWTKKGVRLYPEFSVQDSVFLEAKKLGQVKVVEWFFDGETGKVEFSNPSELLITQDDFKNCIKTTVSCFLQKLSK